MFGAVMCPVHAWANEPAPGEGGSDDGRLAEIVVTAQHRRENLQEVPISVSAVTADTLGGSGISATNVLSQIVPAVQMTRAGPSGLFYVRGVGTSNAAAGEEGANAFYVDGVYMADLGQTITNFNNIDRIEVLKGPQGTLFGRNATGGLIHIITRDPADELTIKAQAGYGNYQTVTGQAYVGGPLSDNVGMDIAFTGQHQGKGWGRNLTLNQETKFNNYWGLRSKLVARPSETVKLTLSGDYYDVKDNTNLAWRIDESNLGTGGFAGPGGQDTTANDPAMTHLKIWGVSLSAEVDLDFANLTSISAIRDNHNDTYFDIDAGPTKLIRFDYTSSARSYQQELRLASNARGPLSWQIGVFYLRSIAQNYQEQRGLAFAPAGRQGQNIDGKMTTDSYAAFGEINYNLTPSTHMTGGVRFTRDKRRFGGTITPISLAGVVGAPVTYPRPGIDLFSDTLKYDEVTYRAALRQDISDDVNVYASVNRGFKAGGFSLQNFNNPPLKPQFIMAYEVGLKSELFDRKLRLNVAAYHYDISDYQVRSIINGTTFLVNAGKVRVNGVDIDFEAAPTKDLRLFGGITLLDSKFSEFVGAGFYYPRPATCAVAAPAYAPKGTPAGRTTGVPTGGLLECFGDASGNRTQLAPKFTGSFGAAYTIRLPDDQELRLNALYSYNSGFFFEPENRLRQKSYGLFNAGIEYRFNRNVGIEIWGKNIGKTDYFSTRSSTGTGAYASLAAPRTYGVNLKLDY
jgi:iron complex outermembrane receptor protein